MHKKTPTPFAFVELIQYYWRVEITICVLKFSCAL